MNRIVISNNAEQWLKDECDIAAASAGRWGRGLRPLVLGFPSYPQTAQYCYHC